MKQIINNNSSLFSNFIKNSIKAPSPEVQQNFMKVTSELVEVIKKILETEKLIFDVSYEGKKYWENAKKHKFAFEAICVMVQNQMDCGLELYDI